MSTPHERIKKLLTRRRLNQMQFAQLLGITPARLNNYLTGKSEATHAILVQMAELLETTTDYILGRKEDYLSLKRIPTLYEITGTSQNDETVVFVTDEHAKRRKNKTTLFIQMFPAD